MAKAGPTHFGRSRARGARQATLLTKYKFSMVDPIKWLYEAPKWEKLWKELFLPVR